MFGKDSRKIVFSCLGVRWQKPFPTQQPAHPRTGHTTENLSSPPSPHHPRGSYMKIFRQYNNVLVSAYFVDSTAVKIMFSWAIRSFTWEIAGNIIFRLRQQQRRTQPNGFCVSHCTIYSKMANEKVELVLSLIEHSRIGLPSIAYKQTKDFNMLPHLHKSSLAIGWAAKF